MVTPLAPTTESMTPCAKTFVTAKAARRMTDEYCILKMCVDWKIEEGQLKDWYKLEE
jgi:hypothetical protein